jgi:hypothetical protein
VKISRGAKFMREYNTKRIQYYLYIDGQYCHYEIDNLGKASTFRMEELSSVAQAVIPDEFLIRMNNMRLVIDSGEGIHLYFTTKFHTDPKIFDMLKERFFEKIFICKADFGTDAYTACFKHR